MDGTAILSLAQRSAARAARRLGRPYDTREDREDAVQEAACAIVAVMQRDADHTDAYLVATGAGAVMRMLTRRWWMQPNATPLDDERAASSMPAAHDSTTALDDVIAHAATLGRRHGGRRSAAACERDRAILELRMSRWSEQAIANELNLTKSNVHMALTRLRQRHEEAAQ